MHSPKQRQHGRCGDRSGYDRFVVAAGREGGGGEKGLQLIENPSSFEQHKIKQMQCDIGKLFCHQVRLASVQ